MGKEATIVQHDQVELFIDGEWVRGSGEVLEVVSPSIEQVIAEVTSASPSDVDAAVTAARRAFDEGPWPRLSVQERVGYLAELRRLLAAEAETLAAVITDEMGCPITQSRTIQTAKPIATLDATIELAETYPFEEVRSSAGGFALVTREPVGVVAAVVPWNVPLGIGVGKVVPAILAGCSVVLKPAPETPLDGLAFAELVRRAGIPAGVINVIPAGRDGSAHLVRHPGVDKVAFTGSTTTGRQIASLCGNDVRRVTLELGGKSAAVILDDADLEATVESLRMGSFRNTGQICTLKTRLLVSEQREPELLERMEALIQSMPVGDPWLQPTEIGPLVSARQRETVEGYIASGRAQGATVVVGGGRPAGLDQGWFVEPTLFSDVTSDMTIAQEEIFGPVVAVMTYRNESEAVAMANDSQYGLNGAVFTRDLRRGLKVARQMRTGVVELNGSPIGSQAPFGGFKRSGVGRENGPEGLDAYTELRSIGVPPELAGALH